MRTTMLLLSALLLLGACGEPTRPKPAVDATFAFDSGGAHHIEGYGAWQVTARRTGELAVAHQVRDDVRSYPPVSLPAAEQAAFWKLVDEAGLATLDVADRPGVPDESIYTFRLEVEGREPVAVKVWQNDLAKHPALVRLRDELRALIERHHGEKPVF